MGGCERGRIEMLGASWCAVLCGWICHKCILWLCMVELLKAAKIALEAIFPWVTHKR